MKPYYSDSRVDLYLADARQQLDELPAHSVDLLVTDPPYGVRWQSGHRHKAFDRMAGDDGSLDVCAVVRQAIQVLRPFRHLYVFGPLTFDGLPVGGSCELVWDKGSALNGGNVALPWAPSQERIAFGVYAPSKANRERGDGVGAARLRRGSVLRVPRLNSTQNHRHPTEKPVRLMRILIESSSTFDEVVLDPFAGSGSTLVAAKAEGRRAIGIEIEERYCEIAAERLSRTPDGAA